MLIHLKLNGQCLEGKDYSATKTDGHRDKDVEIVKKLQVRIGTLLNESLSFCDHANFHYVCMGCTTGLN